jgi:hypothetical protein
MNIAFLFPLHNEEKRIFKVLKLLNYLNKNFKKCKFYFLLNNCTDNTEYNLKNYFKKYKNLIIIKSQSRNRGTGINKALKKIKVEYFAICAIDNAWGFSFYKRAYKKIKLHSNLKIVYGSKSHPYSKIKVSMIRKIISLASSLFLRLLFPEKPNHDTQCIKIFSSKIPLKNFLINYNYFAETQFAILANIFKIPSATLPVTVKKTSNSKVNFILIIYYVIEATHYRILLLFFYFKKIISKKLFTI